MEDEKISQKNFKEVKVQDELKEDSGKGRIRIDPKIIKDLNLRNGDVIQIHNPITGKTTAALLYPGKSEDLGTHTIRIDSSLRRNLGASLGDILEFQKLYLLV